MIKFSPQALVVLRHLKNQGSITAVEASAVHRVRSLSRRITEIATHFCIEKDHKKDVTGQRYVRYSLDSSCDTCQRLFKQVEGL